MQLYRGALLSAGQLKRLSEHQYSCSSASLLDARLQPWWGWLVRRTPLWLAPNLITLLGLAVNVATTLLLLWFSPDARQEPPRWACALCALGVFIYQSLDAIDGKQARRTNTQSPLGELFDHGCDSISTVFIALGACTAVKLGEYPTWMFFQVSQSCPPFDPLGMASNISWKAFPINVFDVYFSRYLFIDD